MIKSYLAHYVECLNTQVGDFMNAPLPMPMSLMIIALSTYSRLTLNGFANAGI